MIHCEENTGFAILSLERVFFDAACRAGFSVPQIHFSYKQLSAEPSLAFPDDFDNKLAYDFSANKVEQITVLEAYIKENDISLVVAFDLGVDNKVNGVLRRAGVKRIISYWGAPMSSLNRGLKLLVKKIEVALRVNKPDLFIFESEAMVLSAIAGRGVPKSRVKLLYLGVDTKKYNPQACDKESVYRDLGIPAERKIVFYSGHMEPRKGVAVIVRAAAELVNQRGYKDLHFVFCGNTGDEADVFKPLYENTPAAAFITFAGYRHDLNRLMASSYIGVIASTGWDSFTMSSVEMASSGLPLIVSDLQGLVETVVAGHTGFKFAAGDHAALANHIETISADAALRDKLGKNSRARVLENFSRETQVAGFANILVEHRPA